MRQTVVIFLLTAAALWGSSISMSYYLSRDYIRSMKRESLLAGELPGLLKEATSRPTDLDAQLRLARALVKTGIDTQDGQLIIEGLGAYRRATEIEPKNTEILLELARLCANQGILDRSVEYYRRYLGLVPDDLDAKTDYGLVLVQFGDGAEALLVFESVIEKDTKQFQAQFGKALALRILDRKAESDAQAEKALQIAPSEEVRAKLRSMMEPKDRSPAEVITTYFKEHPIVGQKIAGIRWVNPTVLELTMREFPVSAMPEVAKNTFVAKAKERIGKLDRIYQIEFVDLESREKLMTIEVGETSLEAAK